LLRYLLIATALLTGALSFVPVTSAEPPAVAEKKKGTEKQAEPEKPSAAATGAKVTVTRHRAVIGGKEIDYTATAGELPVLNDAGDTDARIFYVAYTADRPERSRPRPLLFMFNGGPGAASVWLHLGAVGPRRVQLLPDGNMPAPPFGLTDNASSWLDLADLVFVDPVGTGYSRAAKQELAKNFATVRGDIDSLTRFIRLYLTRNQRWGSPLFLVGESYGSFRCAGLSEYLFEDGIALNGIILVSSVLNLQTISFDFGNDLPYQLYLPSYTATAWYHKKLAPDLQADLERTLSAAEKWAATEYQAALNQGDRLPAQERRLVVEKMAQFTGLSSSFVASRNLRVRSKEFVRELLGDRWRMLGHMDSRFNSDDLDPGSPHTFDPTVATIRPTFTAAFSRYVREELGYESDLEYFVLGGGIERWDWEAKNSYADTSENLRDTMAKNPYMKVFVASGLFDLSTPHFAADYTLAHMGLSPALRKNITVRRYRSGHMMYLESGELVRLKQDVAEFVRGTLQEHGK
jgi:carboxypeptidase C (cathepsin A)